MRAGLFLRKTCVNLMDGVHSRRKSFSKFFEGLIAITLSGCLVVSLTPSLQAKAYADSGSLQTATLKNASEEVDDTYAINGKSQPEQNVQLSVSSEDVRYSASVPQDIQALKRGSAYAVCDGEELIFVRSETPFKNGASLSTENPLISISGQVYDSGTVYTDFENTSYRDSDEVPWEDRRFGITTVTFVDVVSPISCNRWFVDCVRLTTFNSIYNFDTANVKNTSHMFQNCTSLQRLDLSTWDVSSVDESQSMFEGCYDLSDLDLSGWNFRSKDMIDMFNGCEGLEFLDLSGFDTRNTVVMNSMFSNCGSLDSLRLGLFFSFYGNATELQCAVGTSDEKWYKTDGSYVNLRGGINGEFVSSYGREGGMDGVWKKGTYRNGNAYAVFDPDTGTLSFTKMLPSELPQGRTCFEVREIGSYSANDLPAWTKLGGAIKKVVFEETIHPQSTAFWFSNLQEVESIDIHALDTSDTTNMASMFRNCALLESIEGLEYLRTNNVASMSNMFDGCRSLNTLDLSSFNTAKTSSSMANMFNGCQELEQVRIGGQFRFGADCFLPMPAGEGLSGKWAQAHSYSVDQKTSTELANPSFGSCLKGIWVGGRQLSYVVKYFDGDSLKATQSQIVDLDYILPAAQELGIEASDGFNAFHGWTDVENKITDYQATIARNTIAPGTVLSRYAVWGRNITVYTGLLNAPSVVVPQFRNGSYYSALLSPTLFEKISTTSNWAPIGWTDSKTQISNIEEQVIPTLNDGSCQYIGNANELYAVYGRSVELAYDANTQDPVTMPSNNVAVQIYLAGEIEPFDAVFDPLDRTQVRRTGYRFRGYSNSPSSTQTVSSIRFNPRIDAVGTELVCNSYAVWEAVSYTIKFDSNGGSGSMPNQSRLYDDNRALPQSGFLKTGYRIKGWTRSLTSESPDIYPVDYTGNIANEKETLTLYALWELINYDINLSFEGGTLGENKGWIVDNDAKSAVRRFTIEDSVELPSNVTKGGFLFAGWRNDQNQVVTSVETGTAKNCNFEASWLAIAEGPKCDNSLVYSGNNLKLISAGNGYELQPLSSYGSIDVDGNLVGTEAGTYTATAKLKDGFVWSDGSVEDKQCSAKVETATIDKVVIPSVVFGQSPVDNMIVYTRDKKGELVKLTKLSSDISTEVSATESSNFVIVRGKSANISSGEYIKAPYEIKLSPQGRRIETENKDGGFISKTIEEMSGSAPIVKQVSYFNDSKGSSTTIASYSGNNVVLDSNDSVKSGVDAAVLSTLSYSGDTLVAETSKEYTRANNYDLVFSGNKVEGAKNYKSTNLQHQNNGTSKKLVSLYEAAEGGALTIENNEVKGAVKRTNITSTLDANQNETITNINTYVEDRDSSGKVFETLECDYTGDNLEFNDGKVTRGATNATVVNKRYTDTGVIESTTKYTAFDGATLDTLGDPIQGAETIDRSIITKDENGQVVRYEKISSRFDVNGKGTISRVLYEGDDIIVDPATGEVKSGSKTVSGNEWTVESVSDKEKTTISSEVEQDADDNKKYYDVNTNISKKDDGSVVITRIEQQKDALNNPVGNPVTYIFKVVESVDASGLHTTRVINQLTQEETVTVRNQAGEIVFVRNDRINLAGGVLATLPKVSDWIWLDVKKDSDKASARSADIKNDYANKKYVIPTIYTARLNIIDSDNGLFNACRFGLHGMSVQVSLEGNGAYVNRVAHLTQVDSNSIFDVKKRDDVLVGENDILSFTADSLNDFVISVDRFGRKVVFNSNLGSAIKNAAVLEGEKVARPEDPIRAGYIFDGWYSDASCTLLYDFNAEVRDDLTLYAKWVGDLSASTATLSATSMTYTGNAFKPAVKTVALSDGSVVDASNYNVTYVSSNKTTIVEPKAAGTYYAKVEGINGCTNTQYFAFKIAKANLSSSKAVLNKTSVNFNGKAQKPGVKSVAIGSRVLTKSTDYTVSYSSNKNIGKAKVTIKGKGNYTGTKTANFTIKAITNPFKVSARSKILTAYTKKNTTFSPVELYTITNDKSKGQRVYTITGMSKGAKPYKTKLKISSKDGKIVAGKGIKKGTYALKVRVAIKAKGNYKGTLRYVVLKLRVK